MSARGRLLIPTLLALFCLSPVPVQFWTVDNARWATAAPTQTVDPQPLERSGDLDGDGYPETVSLQAGQAVIIHAGQPVWQSPPAWTVREAAIADINRDGHLEAILLVWRKFAPWPIDRYVPHPGRIDAFQDASGESCHIILMGWRRDGYREAWAGSALAEPVRAFAILDANRDGKPDLLTLDGAYADPDPSNARYLSLWEWNGFGFTLAAHETGIYRRLEAGNSQSGPTLVITGR